MIVEKFQYQLMFIGLLTHLFIDCRLKISLINNSNKQSKIQPMKTQVQSEKIKGDFIHMVFFWLKNPENQNDRQAFEKALEKFIATNPQVVSSHIGQPAATERPVIDNTYTYSLVVTFTDIETHDVYQADLTHVLFIEEAESLWKKVSVYDSLIK